jgi:hypothetical protein
LFWGASCLLACPKLGQDTGSSSSDSSSSGGSSGSSGSSASSKRLDQLSTAELSDECKSINDELNSRFSNRRLATYDCTRLYVQSGDATACSQAVNDCVNASPDASPTAPRPTDFTIDGTECTALQDCPVTLSEFDQCISDRFDQSDQLMSLVTCSLANDPEAVQTALDQIDNPRATPSSCTNIANLCPGLL